VPSLSAVLRLAAALFALAVGHVAPSAQTPPPGPRAAGPLADTAAADATRPARRAVRRAPSALDAALARVARVRVPRGAHPPLDARLAGVVWTAPEDRAAAVRDLVAMREAGVRAVRTDVLADTLLLGVASRLGIALWQDLPVVGLPARLLVAEADSAERVLRDALARGARYPAARHYGLARTSDTSDPAARPYVERLAGVVRAAGATSYYVTRFPDADRTRALVDVVLLDARDADPVAMLARWRARHPGVPAGLGAVGAGVRPGREGGWRTRGSEAAQARALETHLTALAELPEPPAVAFVYRWHDAGPDADRRLRGPEVTGIRYGLYGPDSSRAALAVVAGLFTGTQRVFAFDAGRAAADRAASPLLVAGWALALLLGLFYAGAPKLSALAPRYFGRRDLYREAVARGYDLSTGETAGLAMLLVATVGVALSSALRALGRTDALVAATAGWAPAAQTAVLDLATRPFALAFVLALAYATWLMLVVLWLNIVTGRRRLRAAQALSLAVWSRWAWVPLMALALVLASASPASATLLAPTVLVLGGLIEVVAAYRSMLDLVVVANVSPPRALLVGFGLPAALALAGAAWLAVQAGPQLTFLWHLATRT